MCLLSVNRFITKFYLFNISPMIDRFAARGIWTGMLASVIAANRRAMPARAPHATPSVITAGSTKVTGVNAPVATTARAVYLVSFQKDYNGFGYSFDAIL